MLDVIPVDGRIDLAGKLVRKVDLPLLGSAGGIVGNPDEDTGYIGYTSFTEPQVIYKTSIRTGKTAEWARVKLPVDTAHCGPTAAQSMPHFTQLFLAGHKNDIEGLELERAAFCVRKRAEHELAEEDVYFP